MEKSNIIVIKKDLLFDEDYFNGYKDSSDLNYFCRILNSFELKERSLAEVDPNYKQPIAYSLIINNNKYLIYRRASKKKDYKETRLYDKWSLGIGGHIQKIDLTFSKINETDFLRSSLIRESQEELGVTPTSIELLGYINDDSNDVGKVHFGLLYVSKLDNFESLPFGSEIAEIKFLDLKELSDFIGLNYTSIETWSLITYQNFISKNLI